MYPGAVNRGYFGYFQNQSTIQPAIIQPAIIQPIQPYNMSTISGGYRSNFDPESNIVPNYGLDYTQSRLPTYTELYSQNSAPNNMNQSNLPPTNTSIVK